MRAETHHMPNLGCPTGKWRYINEKFARLALRNQREKGIIKRGHPYVCERCNGWHLTSQPRNKKLKP